MTDDTWRPESDVWANMPAPYLDALRREASEWAERVLPAYWEDFQGSLRRGLQQAAAGQVARRDDLLEEEDVD